MTWCIDPRVSSLFFHFSSFFTLLRELSGRAVFHSLVRFRSVRYSVQQCCWVLPIDDDSLPLFRRDPYFINYHHLRALDVFACYSLRWSHELEIFSIFFTRGFLLFGAWGLSKQTILQWKFHSSAAAVGLSISSLAHFHSAIYEYHRCHHRHHHRAGIY